MRGRPVDQRPADLPLVPERFLDLPEASAALVTDGLISIAPAATARATTASGSSTTSSMRVVAPPTDSGLKLPCSGDSSATQNVARADGELRDDGLVLVGPADAVVLDGAESRLVEVDRRSPATHGQLGLDARPIVHRRASFHALRRRSETRAAGILARHGGRDARRRAGAVAVAPAAPRLERGLGLGAGGRVVRRRVARHGDPARPPRAAAARARRVGAHRRVRAERRRRAEARPRARRRPVRPLVRRRRLRAASVLARRRAAHRPRAGVPRRRAAGRPAGLRRRPQRAGDAGLPARAAGARLRRRHDGAGRRAARLGDAVARAADAAGAALAARAAVRARARLARRAGARSRRLRRRARARAVVVVDGA